MAVEHVKSTPVSNADATPVVPNLTGAGAAGYAKEVSGFVTVPASASIDSTFRLCRVPSDAIVKNVLLASDAQAAGAVDIGVYYPTTGPTATADLAANAIDQDFFASAVSLAAASGLTDVTFEAAGAYAKAEYNKPLWEALGLSADPGGYLDIVATVTTAITTGTGTLLGSVRFIV